MASNAVMAATLADEVWSVERALTLMAGRRVLLVGDFLLDVYVYGETVRVSREAPVLVVRKENTQYRLGGAANTAANLAALGVETLVFGVLGGDASADVLAQLLQQAGADTRALLRVERTTPVKTRILAGAFGTSKQQILRVDDEPAAPVSEAVAEALAAALEERAAQADVVVVSDYGSGVLTEPVIRTVRRLAQQGRCVCVDSRFQLSRFGGVTAITPNVPEAEALVGFSITGQHDVERAGSLLLEQLDLQACLLTQGRRGMTLFQRDFPPTHVDIVGSDEVTDVTGAGDTVMATFGAGLAAGLGMANSMRLANCAAGTVVTKAGAATVSPWEVCQAAVNGAVELEPWVR